MDSQSQETMIAQNDGFTVTPVLNIEYILTRIDKIIADTAHLHEAIASLCPFESNIAGLPEGLINYQGDIAGQAKANAIAEVVRGRETTNQQMIRFLEKMYDDLKPKDYEHPQAPNPKVETFTSAVAALAPFADSFNDMDDVVKQLIDKL